MRLASRPGSTRRVSPADYMGTHHPPHANTLTTSRMRSAGARKPSHSGAARPPEKPLWTTAKTTTAQPGLNGWRHSAREHGGGSGYAGYGVADRTEKKKTSRPVSATPRLRAGTVGAAGWLKHGTLPPGIPPPTRMPRPKSAAAAGVHRCRPPGSNRPEAHGERQPYNRRPPPEQQDRVHVYRTTQSPAAEVPEESSLPSARTQAVSDRSSSLVYGKRQEPSKTEDSPREIIGVRDKSTCEEASENEAAMQAAKRPVLRPSSASAGRRQEKINLVGAERMQRPQSASGQPRLHGGVRHAEFFRPSSSGASRRDQGDECSPEQQEFLRRLLAASATHRRGVPSMYNFGKVIGVGSFGTVRLGYHKLTGHRVAIKTYERAKMKDPQQWKRVQQEARVMEKLSDFPPVCRFLEAFETASPRKAHLIMEHLGGGSLCSYVKSKRKLTEAQVQPLMFQVAVALEHMHSLDVVHRDIKLENILFSDNSHRIVRIIDFGFSTRCAADRRLRLFCGTPSYMAPEIVRRHEYRGKPIDLWSFGVVVYACLSGHFPFAAKSQPDLYRKILRGTFHLPDGLSDGAAALIQAAILVDVNRRIAAPELRRHFWLTSGVSESDLRAGTKIGSHTRSKHPKDDFHAELLNRMTETMGVPRDTVVNGIMRAEHSPITACYYLLMGMRRNDNVIDSNTEDAPGQNKISSPTHTVVAAA